MDIDKFIKWYSLINQNKFNEKYSPHKPITILFALSKTMQRVRWINYKEDRGRLEEIIWGYSNHSTKPNCLQPLHRLCNDSKAINIWTETPGISENQSGDISSGDAIKHNYQAGFADETYQWLVSSKATAQLLIEYILDDNFPETLHEDLLTQLGIDEIVPTIVDEKNEIELVTITRSKRDPNFRKVVMQAYDYRCAFCGLKIYSNKIPLALEAAHIKWKARGGECSIHNGLSLCPTHHYTFDKGIWSIDTEFRIKLSPNALFDTNKDRFFLPFVGNSVVEYLLDEKLKPHAGNIEWHQNSILS